MNTGLIAQEVEAVFPDLVSRDAQGYRMVNYGELPMLTLAAVGELKARGDDLGAQVASLQAQNDALRAENASIRAQLAQIAALVADLQKRQ